MNAHALSVLEFSRSVDMVAERAHSALGAERVREALPTSDRGWIELEHSRVWAMRALVDGDARWKPQHIADIRPSIARLRVTGASLGAADLLKVLTFLRASRLTAESLADPALPAVSIALVRAEVGALVVAPKEEKTIESAIDDNGEVRDDASPLLRRIRREMRGAQGELVKLLERIMARLEAHHQAPDMSVTVRNGRFVIPVRREARVSIGGIVHDSSSTGATLFVEPPAAVEAGNRIRELESDELREIDRILSELTDFVRPQREPMASALVAMVALDSLYARARFAIELGCGVVEFNEPGAGFTILRGRHPLLVAQGIDVVPFDLTLDAAERTLLISGPNTGGKTVLLKSLGLFAAMAQAGIPVPVSPESRLAIFDDVYADIGDEQSISSSLSTFSAHLKNLAEVLRSATPESLVLIDELGSGTDPVEGAALGGAILESLTARGSLSVATTHLGALKELAIDVSGVVNASLQFDSIALAPTYRLIKGIPGRSYGLSIARRLKLPEDVLSRAEARLPTGERDVNALLAELEAREQRLGASEREAAGIADDVRVRARRVAERELAVRDKERTAERDARREARRLLLDAR
nr:endonuclease MutS2 [Gemmatimonadaceae bacterium]